ncbi:hypothetical protein ACFXG6_25525 [Streptomyces roseus]|uniref:hypothetical protein n=1 Tax=Streptomyces roseus TaxID=66430 RepID=UPI003693038E
MHGTIVGKDVHPISQLTLSATALERLTKYVGNITVDQHGTAAGAKRERKLEKIVDVLRQQAWELTRVGPCAEPGPRERPGRRVTGSSGAAASFSACSMGYLNTSGSRRGRLVVKRSFVTALCRIDVVSPRIHHRAGR